MSDLNHQHAAQVGGGFLILGVVVGIAGLARWIGLGLIGTFALAFIVLGFALLAAGGWGDGA